MDPKMKLIGALVVAAGALGVAGWLGYSSMGGARTVRSASDAARQAAAPGEPAGGAEDGSQSVEIGGPAPGWVRDEQARSYDGEDVSFPSSGDAVAAFDTGSEDLSLRAEQDDALDPLGIGARRGLVETWRAFMRPIVAGDAEAFERALVSMGGDVGVAGEDGGSRATALHDRLSGFLEGARLDLASAAIIDRDATQRGEVPLGRPMALPDGPGGPDIPSNAIPIMVEMSVEVDESTGEETRNRMMVIPLTTVFPDAAARAMDGAKTVEVWVPAKLAGGRGSDGDLGPSGFFVHDRESGRWQPVALRVALVSEAASGRLDELMRSRRRAQD